MSSSADPAPGKAYTIEQQTKMVLASGDVIKHTDRKPAEESKAGSLLMLLRREIIVGLLPGPLPPQLLPEEDYHLRDFLPK